MFRRHFIQRVTLAGAGLLPAVQMARASETRTVIYRITGFTCIACAVGLETMLRLQKGVSGAEASYRKAIVRIEFDPAVVTEKSLRKYISDVGFRVAEQRGE